MLSLLQTVDVYVEKSTYYSQKNKKSYWELYKPLAFISGLDFILA